MPRLSPLFRLGLCGLGTCALLAGCRDRAQLATAPERKGPLIVAEQPPLPEDPAAGKRSEEQWRKHLQAEELERQMLFDRYRLEAHRDLIQRFTAARKRLDDTKTRADLKRARTQLAPMLQELRAGVDGIDRWKNSSHILSDYEALLRDLQDSYPEARLAAMGGDTRPLAQARASFDAHLRAMNHWLDRCEDGDLEVDEGE